MFKGRIEANENRRKAGELVTLFFFINYIYMFKGRIESNENWRKAGKLVTLLDVFFNGSHRSELS
jgi:hypothetical protein